MTYNIRILPFTALALAASLLCGTGASPTPSKPKRSTNSTAHSPKYTLVQDYSYPNFFDGFDLFNAADPTHGYIDYVDYSVAKTNELIGWVYREETNSSTAWISADANGAATNGRQSVRLISQQNFTVGTLAVIDMLHEPVGFGPGGSGLWPAVWFLGAEGNWPYSGEIDVIEYVNPTKGGVNGTGMFNSMTLHTGPDCSVDDAPSDYAGSLVNANCSYTENDILGSSGCSIPAPANNTFHGRSLATAGPAFNAQGGGVYVMSWTTSGVAVWLFPRSGMPSDLKSGHPNPASWRQKPLAKFSGKGCDFSKSLLPMNLIINVDVCGDWAGNVYPGGPEACVQFAQENPKAYREAYFEFESIKIYGSG